MANQTDQHADPAANPKTAPTQPDDQDLPPDVMVPDPVHDPPDPAVPDILADRMEDILGKPPGREDRPHDPGPGSTPRIDPPTPPSQNDKSTHRQAFDSYMEPAHTERHDPTYHERNDAAALPDDLSRQHHRPPGLLRELLGQFKKHIATVIMVAITSAGFGLLFNLINQARNTVTPYVTYPTPTAQAEPTAIPRPQQTAIQPLETAGERIIMQNVQQLTTAVDSLAAEVHELTGNTNPNTPENPGPTAPTIFTVNAAPLPITQPLPPQLSIWEDGNCWTPAHTQVLHLCGADAGDGYVVRWNNVQGDSEGPRIPDADYLAVRSTGDQLLWAGQHPGTGEMVTINYWSGGHTLAVHAAGRLLFRIDRNHNVQ